MLLITKRVTSIVQTNMTIRMATGALTNRKGTTTVAHMSLSIGSSITDTRGRSAPASRLCPTCAKLQPAYVVSPDESVKSKPSRYVTLVEFYFNLNGTVRSIWTSPHEECCPRSQSENPDICYNSGDLGD